MRGGARPWVAAILAIALLAIAILSLGDHGSRDHATHAVECGLCLFAHADAPAAPPSVAESPREAEAVVLFEAPRPTDAATPVARARGPPAA